MASCASRWHEVLIRDGVKNHFERCSGTGLRRAGGAGRRRVAIARRGRDGDPMSPTDFDVAIIGGGVVGMATAMVLASGPPLTLGVLGAEGPVAGDQSSHNT